MCECWIQWCDVSLNEQLTKSTSLGFKVIDHHCCYVSLAPLPLSELARQTGRLSKQHTCWMPQNTLVWCESLSLQPSPPLLYTPLHSPSLLLSHFLSTPLHMQPFLLEFLSLSPFSFSSFSPSALSCFSSSLLKSSLKTFCPLTPTCLVSVKTHLPRPVQSLVLGVSIWFKLNYLHSFFFFLFFFLSMLMFQDLEDMLYSNQGKGALLF